MPDLSAERLLLKGARLIHADGTVTDPADLMIADRSIESVSAADGEAGPGPEGVEVIDCRGRFISPGLVNLHAHSPMNIFRGIAEDVTPDDWFNREIWPYESRMEPGDVETGARLAAAEMLDYGVTAFADHYFMADRICRAVLDSGIRADIAPTLFGMAGDFEAQLADSEALIGEWNGREGLLSLRLGPHSHYTCSPEQLAQCARSAGKLGVGVHLHVEDGKEQIAASIEQYGKTPMQVVDDAGLTALPLIIGHAYWILPEERPLVRRNNWIAVSMMSYMKLGLPPGPILEDPGDLPLCIGTDGAASSNCLNPLEQARLLALAGKSRQADGEAFNIKSVWKMLMRGHEALPFGTGRLEPGAPADLVVWDLDRPHTAPVYDPLASLIYSADARNAEHVLVAGRRVKSGGRLRLDVAPVVSEAKQRARAILERGRGETKLVF